MIQNSCRALRSKINYVKIFLASLLFICGVSLASPVMHVSAASTHEYSCGTYSAGSYSNGGGCPDDGSGIKPPDTGFAKLMQPSNLLAIIGSLLLLGVGVGIVVKLRKRHS